MRTKPDLYQSLHVELDKLRMIADWAIGSWIVAWGEELRRCTARAHDYHGHVVGRCEKRAGHHQLHRCGGKLWVAP